MGWWDQEEGKLDDPKKEITGKMSAKPKLPVVSSYLIIPCDVIPALAGRVLAMLAYDGQIAVIIMVIHCAPDAP